jgi:hypothetical protein
MMHLAALSDAAPDLVKEAPMTAITLRNIPPKLQEFLLERAERDDLSLNKVVLRMLEEAAGLRGAPREHRDLDHLAGTWSAEEAAEFEAVLKDQRRIDPELWE